MAYRIDPVEPVAGDVRRVLGEQLGRAAATLRGGGPDAAAVHEVRKRIKKSRSLLRLTRGGFGAAVVRRANDELRAVAASLAGRRDADAMVETVDRLAAAVEPGADTEAGQRTATALRQLREDLLRRVEGPGSDVGLDHSTVVGAALALERTRVWLDQLPVEAEDWDVLAAGLERAYARGRALLLALPPEPSVEELHEWRKRAKDLWYHQRLLRRLWPEAQRPVVDAAARLADVLGEDHDLGVLRDLLTDAADGADEADGADGASEGPGAGAAGDASVALPAPSDEARAGLTALIDRERSRLQGEARHLGALLYADSPKGWSARHAGWWREAARGPLPGGGGTDRSTPGPTA